MTTVVLDKTGTVTEGKPAVVSVLAVSEDADAVRSLARDAIACAVVQAGGTPASGACLIEDSEGLVAGRYDARPGTCYLMRPDQHVCARWRGFELGAVRAAIARATAHAAEAAQAAKAAA